jgi:hypothetical protein
MKLKPKSTTKNPKALVYKRFIGLEKSINYQSVYATEDGFYWTFDNLTLTFEKTDNSLIPPTSKIISIVSFRTFLQYQNTFFRYNDLKGWEIITDLSGENIVLLNATFNNIAKYQTNKYYYVGNFDFTIKGSIEGATAQYIKGNIIPLKSLNIKYYEDNIDLSVDDLVVVDGHLYSVENPETSIKQQPKPFKIHFATLNSIL